MRADEHFQIGEVADRTGLSLRTIRYYEEIGLVEPSGRTEGGFRLYTEADVDRLLLVKHLKPLGLSLETMSEMLEARDHLVEGSLEPEAFDRLVNRLGGYLAEARARADELGRHLRAARGAVDRLEEEAEAQRLLAGR